MNATLPRIWQPPKPKARPVTAREAMESALDLIDLMTIDRQWPGTMSIAARQVRELLEAALSGKGVQV